MELVSVFWFRRDLRLDDNAALYYALKSKHKVLPVFIFDTEILDKLENKYDRRVDFIHRTVSHLQEELKKLGSSIKVFYTSPKHAFEQLLQSYRIKCVYANHDYEPLAIDRDNTISALLHINGIEFKTYKDQCIFEKNEVIKDDGTPYTIFTPYSKKWKSKLNTFYIKSYPTKKYFYNFLNTKPFPIPALESMGFKKTHLVVPEIDTPTTLIIHYKEQRNFPAINGTSRLSIHLRFGTVSVRLLVQKALRLNETWLNELIWRDFYMMILHHFPHVVSSAFKPQYNRIMWRNNEHEFKLWCEGKTGYPIVDAGMRELNATGFMHNRVRMIVASFLIKDLLIDWKWGEAYFAEKLNDFDLSANNGGWQWAASCGCDAAPYFRIFNPAEQTKKFDPHLEYIKKWVPEFNTTAYVKPIIDHNIARTRTLAAYKNALTPDGQINLFE